MQAVSFYAKKDPCDVFTFPPMLSRTTESRSAARSRHMATVLRLKSGQRVEFFDGQGHGDDRSAQVVDRHRVIAEIIETRLEGQHAQSPPYPGPMPCSRARRWTCWWQKDQPSLGYKPCLPLVSRYCENRGETRPSYERWQTNHDRGLQSSVTAPFPWRSLPLTPDRAGRFFRPWAPAGCLGGGTDRSPAHRLYQ